MQLYVRKSLRLLSAGLQGMVHTSPEESFSEPNLKKRLVIMEKEMIETVINTQKNIYLCICCNTGGGEHRGIFKVRRWPSASSTICDGQRKQTEAIPDVCYH